MEYARLGNTGLMVSELCLGCMTFGQEADEETSREIVGRFLDAGGNFVDTADVYSNGVSEEITGRALRGVRDDVVLATKVRFPMGEGPNDVGLSRKHIMQGCEDSLRRLGTDYIDLYQVHCWDEATPLEESLSALTDLVRSGKVRYIGVSNFTGWQLMRSLDVSEAGGFERFVCLQPQYSLVERNIEREVLPVCVEEGLGVIPWSPLGGGFLSGKYRRDEEPPEGSRIAGAEEWQDEYWDRRATERNWATLRCCGQDLRGDGQILRPDLSKLAPQAKRRDRPDHRRPHAGTTGGQHRRERLAVGRGTGRRTLRSQRPGRRLPIPLYPQRPTGVGEVRGGRFG